MAAPPSGQLPDENAAAASVQRRFSGEFSEMRRTLDTVLGMLDDGWDVRTDDYNGRTVRVCQTLLVKGCKTFRAVRHLCELGIGQDAAVLLRVLFETSVSVAWLFHDDTDRRAHMLLLHGHLRRLVHAEKMMEVDGLRERGQQLHEALSADVDNLDERGFAREELKAIRTHWSGTRGLEDVVRRLEPSEWLQAYTVVYRELSQPVHVADLLAHISRVESRERVEDDVFTFRLSPSTWGQPRIGRTARLLLHSMASTMNERFALGFEEQLSRVERPRL
jgi:hypothetical protein